MPAFSKKSLEKLKTCDPALQELFSKVVQHFDCTILAGHRSMHEQNALYNAGRSRVKFPDSKHNSYPSRAVDVAPYPVDWKDRDRFHYFAGFVKGIASQMQIPLRWGGDWDDDTQTKDNNFDDLPHFELGED